MFKKILLGLVALIVVFLVVVAFQPADFKIERRETIAAPPSVVFAQVNDFHKWHAWSPWEKMDPTSKGTYTGVKSGRGAIFEWVGGKTGQGRMTMIESHPNSTIRIRLEFIKPFQATNDTRFTFLPKGKGTVVTWTMTGTNGFMGKAFGLIMNMDKMVGGQFAEGLGYMKEISEAAAKKHV